MDVLIVIVNYKSASLAVDCLRTLEPEVRGLPGGARVVITDNLSPDDSVAHLNAAVAENRWSDWVTIQPLDRNGGFAYGNNAAIRPALEWPEPPRFVLLLNPDTLVHPGLLRDLVAFMDAHPKVGIAGAGLDGPDGQPIRAAYRFPSVLSELENGVRLGIVSRLLSDRTIQLPLSDVPHRADWASGACLMIRAEVLRTVGLLDEEFFMYFEETDLCARAGRAGWECWCVPHARVVHLEGMSSESVGPPPTARRRPAYWFRSRRRFFLKNRGRLHTLAADLAWACGYATYRVRRILQGKPDVDNRLLLWDFVRHNFIPGR